MKTELGCLLAAFWIRIKAPPAANCSAAYESEAKTDMVSAVASRSSGVSAESKASKADTLLIGSLGLMVQNSERVCASAK